MRLLPKGTLSLLSLLFCLNVLGQGILTPADSLNIRRLVPMIATEALITSSTLIGLQFAWYQQYDQQPFRFFNDWPGWMQMDKIGHATSTYQISTQIHHMHRWTGMKPSSARWLSSSLALGYLTAVEVMDGFSSGWGFSLYDMAFNTFGVGLFHVQDALLGDQMFKLKFSFSPSGMYAKEPYGLEDYEIQRAEYLYSKSITEQWLKDYNGQTFWLNTNLWMATGKAEWMPKWIDLSIGYGADGMLGAESNTWYEEQGDVSIGRISSLQRSRQYLLSLDLNLDHVDLPKGLIWLRPVVHFIKLPFPALELNDRHGLRFRPFYF